MKKITNVSLLIAGYQNFNEYAKSVPSQHQINTWH